MNSRNLLNEFSQNVLMNFAAVAIHKKLGPLENGDETFRDHHVSHIEARINYLGKASEKMHGAPSL